jgi:hypothetical protein
MDADEHAVAGQPYVALERVRAVVDRPTVGRKRVLGLVLRRAAVGDDVGPSEHPRMLTRDETPVAPYPERGENNRLGVAAMRSLARGCAAAGLAVGAVVATAGPSHADTVFQAQTAATGVHLVLTQQPASSIVTASLVDDATAYAAGAFDSSGGSEAQSASVFPGTLVVQGPALFCSQVFTCPATPPDYPLLADASYPRRSTDRAPADQRPVGSGPLVVAPSTSTAAARADGNEAATSADSVSILAGTPVSISVGSSTATSRLTSTANGLVSHVESTVTDVDIANLVHVRSIRAVDDIGIVATGKLLDNPHIAVAGVTVAGVPAQIDENGIHVAGQTGPGLTQQLAQQGVDVRTVGTQRNDTGSVARSEATGLVVTFSVPVSGVPYVPNPLPAPFDQVPGVNANGTYLGHVTLGAVGAVAGANAEPTFALGATFPLSSTPAGVTPTGGVVADNPLLGAPAAPVHAPQVSPPVRVLRGILDGFTTDLATLYAVLAVGTSALFIGWRVTVALRRPRALAGRGG